MYALSHKDHICQCLQGVYNLNFDILIPSLDIVKSYKIPLARVAQNSIPLEDNWVETELRKLTQYIFKTRSSHKQGVGSKGEVDNDIRWLPKVWEQHETGICSSFCILQKIQIICIHFELGVMGFNKEERGSKTKRNEK